MKRRIAAGIGALLIVAASILYANAHHIDHIWAYDVWYANAHMLLAAGWSLVGVSLALSQGHAPAAAAEDPMAPPGSTPLVARRGRIGTAVLMLGTLVFAGLVAMMFGEQSDMTGDTYVVQMYAAGAGAVFLFTTTVAVIRST